MALKSFKTTSAQCVLQYSYDRNWRTINSTNVFGATISPSIPIDNTKCGFT